MAVCNLAGCHTLIQLHITVIQTQAFIQVQHSVYAAISIRHKLLRAAAIALIHLNIGTRCGFGTGYIQTLARVRKAA